MSIDPTDYELEIIQEQQQGPPGPRGVDGNTVWNGNGPPTLSIGKIGDWYINTSAWYIYGPRDITGWPTGVALTGPVGATGLQGPAGNTVLNGTGAPSNILGNPGDFYIDTALWQLYGPKGSSSWPGSPVNLIGPTGGRTIWNGTGAPSSGLGTDGDFYIRTDTWYIYGPKASGSWPAGVSIVGPTGATGATGATGPAGTLTPTALGASADFNSQTTTDWYYTVDTSSTHAPSAGAQWYLTVFQANDANTIAQVAIIKDSTPCLTYTRTMIGGTWGNWHLEVIADGGETITGGFSLSPYSIGNFPNPFTPASSHGNYQYGTNNGAFTFNAPASDCALSILITNSSTAGAITFSGYTVASGNTGDNLDTVNGHKFILSILRINSVSTYMVKALQ